MSRCKSCGAEIVWIKSSKTGKMIPCDAELIKFELDIAKGERFVTPEGDVCCGHRIDGSEGKKLTHIKQGHISHFATCPQANIFRRR